MWSEKSDWFFQHSEHLNAEKATVFISSSNTSLLSSLCFNRAGSIFLFTVLIHKYCRTSLWARPEHKTELRISESHHWLAHWQNIVPVLWWICFIMWQTFPVSTTVSAQVPKLSGIKAMASKTPEWAWRYSTWGNATIFSRQACALPSPETKNSRSVANFVTLCVNYLLLLFPESSLVLKSHCHVMVTCGKNDHINLHVNEYLQHKTAVIKKDMIFIWYGNVNTYALQLINYSYCLVFFGLWYTLCILFLRQMRLWNRRKKEVRRKKEGSVGASHFDYRGANEEKLRYICEWQETWSRAIERERERCFSFFLDHLFHVCR